MDVVGGFYKKKGVNFFQIQGRWFFWCWEGVGLFQGTYIYIYILLIITVYDVYIFMYTYSYLCASSYHIYTLEHRGYHYVFFPIGMWFHRSFVFKRSLSYGCPKNLNQLFCAQTAWALCHVESVSTQVTFTKIFCRFLWLWKGADWINCFDYQWG